MHDTRKTKKKLLPNSHTLHRKNIKRERLTTEHQKTLRDLQTVKQRLDEQTKKHQQTRKLLLQTQKAYNRFVPHQFFSLLEKKNIMDVQLGDQLEKTMTILFSDIRSFTTLSESMSPQQNFNFINSYLREMEPVIGEHHGMIDKYVGDAIMALFPTSADDALQGAIGMLYRLMSYNQGREKAGYRPIEIGIGLNTGLLMLGTVGGANRMEGTVISDAVNLASRVEGLTKNYGANLLISEHTFYNLKNADRYCIRFVDRVVVKGKKQPQSVYEVFDTDTAEVREGKKSTVKTFEEALAFYHFKQIPQAKELLQTCLRANPQDVPAQVYLDRCNQFLHSGVHIGTGELDLVVAWTPDIAVGIPEIDEQHRELYAYAHELIAAVRTERHQDKIEKMLAFLDAYSATHFKTEERYMRRHAYPFYALQKKQHARFIKYFGRLKQELKELEGNRTYLTFRIQILVVDWLVNHTSKEDRHFGKFLQNKT